MSWIADRLKIDPPETTCQITAFIQGKLGEFGRAGVVLGLSGGLDSAVVAYLAVRAAGPDQVTLLNLPDRDSKPRHIEHARLVAEALGAAYETRDITTLLEQIGIYDLVPLNAFPGQSLRSAVVRFSRALIERKSRGDLLAERLQPAPDSWLAKGNAYMMAKHRLRMVLLYYHADQHKLAVIGAANRTEYLTGTFSQWGCDHCADLMPILHLYRSQLPPLAEYLGVPEAIRTKAADMDMMPGVDDKEALLGSFEISDQVLWGLEHRVPRVELDAMFGKQTVDRLAHLWELSRPLREAPYGLDSSIPGAHTLRGHRERDALRHLAGRGSPRSG